MKKKFNWSEFKTVTLEEGRLPLAVWVTDLRSGRRSLAHAEAFDKDEEPYEVYKNFFSPYVPLTEIFACWVDKAGRFNSLQR
jgi:hypothetical protein